MIPHLWNVLAELPVHLVMPAVFDKWDLPIDKSGGNSAALNSSLERRSYSDNDIFDDHQLPNNLAIASQILYFHHLTVSYDSLWGGMDPEGDMLVGAVEKLWKSILEHPSSHLLRLSFFCPHRLLMGPSSNWSGRILEFYMHHWDDLTQQEACSVARSLCQVISSFLEPSDNNNIGSSLLASNHSLDFFTSINPKICRTGDFFEYPFQKEEWIILLTRVQHIHCLPAHYFDPIPGFFKFPPTHQELKDFLSNPFTSEYILPPAVNLYEKCWHTLNSGEKEVLVVSLIECIGMAIPLTVSNSPHSSSPHEDSPQVEPSNLSEPPSTFLKSWEGLQFLTIVNDKLAKEYTSMQEYASKAHGSLMGQHDTSSLISEATFTAWINALKCMQDLFGLPSDYFGPIPFEKEEISSSYHPPRTMSEQEIEIAELENLVGNAPTSTEQGRYNAGDDVEEHSPIVHDVAKQVDTVEVSDAIQGTVNQKDKRDVGGPGADNNV
ncbi:hypothetical protein L218DRAFT_1010258 [Marasmius fiardii PR-910]|nr:hypothetical protein L218DRAFT_1010258 [Marasmius fiardii PR-910]